MQPLARVFAAILVAGLAAPAFAQMQTSRPGHPAMGTWGVDLTSIDKSVAPGDDFFMFVNGSWYKTAVIPPDRSRTGSFDDLRILSEKRMQDIADGLHLKPYDSLSDDEKKLRDLYEAYNDRAQIEMRGLAPARADLDFIAALKTPEDVARAFGSPRLDLGGPFNVDIDVNDKTSTQYVVKLYQGGLGMPNRDYYLRDGKEFESTRAAYKKYLATILTLGGGADGDTRAALIFDLEHKIAEAQWPNADRRDRDKTYNPMSISELKAFAPQFPWDAFLGAAQIAESKANVERQVIVHEKSAFPVLAKIFADTPLEVWRDYMTAHYLHANAQFLPKAFDDADFGFYGTVLQGNPKELDRKIRAVRLLDRLLGEAFGKLYTAKYFPPEAKAKAQTLVENLLKVYDADIRVLPWMTEATRQKALAKLHKFTPHIGYPDQWRDYSAYRVSRDDLIGDVQRGMVFEWQRQVDRLDKPVDRSEWSMTPPTINAYYTQSFNAIFFPAGILQPPFFDPNADDAANYGGIGAVIGHEISHGFDDQGSKYDGDGALANWWTDDDRKAFDAATAMLRKQYDSYEPLPGLRVNGAFTMGENIADLSGLTIALKAYHLSLGGKPAPVKSGYTGDQRFFLSFGQIWRQKMRDSALRQQLLSDSHSPGEFRAIGATRNLDGWYDAFAVTPKEKYYLAPENRVRLW